MMNKKFAKLDADNTIIYAPDSVSVIVHHHDEIQGYAEYDEDGNGIGDLVTTYEDYDTEYKTLFPTAEEYRNAKSGPYLPVSVTAPVIPNGKRVASESWVSDGSRIYKNYTFEDYTPVAPVYILSKLKCYMALKEMGAWDAVYKWLNDNDLWIAFVLANEVRTDHPQFVQGFATIKSMLGLTDAQGDSFIANCIME